MNYPSRNSFGKSLTNKSVFPNGLQPFKLKCLPINLSINKAPRGYQYQKHRKTCPNNSNAPKFGLPETFNRSINNALAWDVAV